MGSGCIDPRFLDLGTSWSVASFTPWPLYPSRKGPRDALYRRLGGPQSRCGRRGEEKILYLTGTRTTTLDRPARSQSLYRLRYPGSCTKCGAIFYCYYLPYWDVQTAILQNAFYRVEQGALGMSIWNQGGGRWF
jgi:hypothetical protein